MPPAALHPRTFPTKLERNVGMNTETGKLLQRNFLSEGLAVILLRTNAQIFIIADGSAVYHAFGAIHAAATTRRCFMV
jgi:hypothetical protein